jgi:SAM-dependent methyltransferase
MGTGTYVLHPELIARLARAYEGDADARPRDWTGWLDGLCRSGERLAAFRLRGGYVNVNSRDDLNRANYLVRDRSFGSRATSLVYLLDEETEAAVAPIAKFAAQPELHEVVVACRRRLPALDRLAALPNVRTVVAPMPECEVGDLLRLGLDAARGDILVLGYSDDTFVPQDVPKLLVYLRDADMVVGTRTTRQMIEQGANMRGVIRVVHVLLAKLVELLWWRFESRFSDICCVFRAFWRSTYEGIRPQLTARGVEIFPELVLETLRARRRIIEIPVNYHNRDVEAPYVRSRYQSSVTLWRVLLLIARKRLGDFGLWRRHALPQAPTVAPAEADSHRRMEREWQDTVGEELLEKPHEAAGAALVFNQQFDWIADALRAAPPGPIVEVGCGRGHLLQRLREKPWLAERTLVGIELSRAVLALRGSTLVGVRGDGESLPLREASVAALVYDGALHHLIDYPQGIREATRALAPGGILVLLEPVSSVFSRTVHRCLDPLVFRRVVYESPIDRLYKDRFREDVVVAVIREGLALRARARSDFLAYPLTGCYAGSTFGRSVRFMRAMLALERLAWRVPGLRQVAALVAWRFAVVAVKPATA